MPRCPPQDITIKLERKLYGGGFTKKWRGNSHFIQTQQKQAKCRKIFVGTRRLKKLVIYRREDILNTVYSIQYTLHYTIWSLYTGVQAQQHEKHCCDSTKGVNRELSNAFVSKSNNCYSYLLYILFFCTVECPPSHRHERCKCGASLHFYFR